MLVPLDWVFLAVLAASLLLGAWRGLVYEVLSVMGWIAAFILAQWLAPDAAAMLPMGKAGEAVRYVAGFVVVFIAVVFTAGLVAWAIKRLVQAVGLRPIDRTLGAMFGLLRGVVLLLATAVVVHMTPFKRADWWTESKGADASVSALKGLKPVLPEQFGKYLPG
jgi:membrane protein required for colicin V production